MREPQKTEFLTVKEAASHWGVALSTIHRWVKDGRIRVHQPAGKKGRIFIERVEFANR